MEGFEGPSQAMRIVEQDMDAYQKYIKKQQETDDLSKSPNFKSFNDVYRKLTH